MEKEIIEIIKKELEQKQEISINNLLKEDLNITSFKMMLIVMQVEENLNIDLDFSILPNLKTVSDFIQWVIECRKSQSR